MQSPMITVAEVNAPGGPTFTAASSSEAELTDPQDPLSLVSLTDTLEIDGRTTTTVYTAATRTLMQTSPEGRVSTLEIDAQGRVVSSQFGGLAPITASFNTLGQLESMTHGVGENARTTQFSYGANGFRSGLTDPLGRIVSYAYDAAGRMTAKTLPGNVEVGFGYNAAGELSSITPPGQAAHEFSHSKFGRLAGYNPPAVTDGGENAYSYNADRLLTGIDRPGGEGVTVEYDDNGRIGSLQLTEDGSPVATYSYSYVTATQVDTVIGPGAQTVSYSYQGDLVTGESWAGGVVGAVSWTWDSAFRLASENVTGGATVNFTYDADDLLTGAGSYVITRSMAHGLAQSAALGVMKDSWAYNDFGEVTGYTANANATSVYDLDYTRDDLGRITQKVETIVGVTDTWDYDYDPRGELIETRKNSVVVESYSYDTNGNRLSTTLNAITLNASYDAQDRLVDYGGTKYHYSPAGHLETRAAPGNQATGYDYDPAGNLRSVTLPDTTVVSYAYDGLDRRIERKVNGTITQRWLYDGGLLLAELDGDDNLVSQFVYAGGHVPVYLIQGGVNYRIITDQVGSVRLVVNANDGSIVQRLDYDSFGNVLQDTNPGLQPFGFAGGLQDPDTGLVLFGARDYDPLTGRWTAKDPLLFGGDDTNLYRYANNNPINLADPNGTDFWDNAHGFLMGIGEGTMKLLNLGLAIQSAVEGMTDWLIGDWLDENGFYRKPYAGMLYPPPAGVDTSDYLDGHFYGECSVDLLSLGAGGFVGAAPKLGALGGKLASAADKLRRIPDLFKGLGNGLGKGLGRAWDEAAKLGKKLWDSVALDASSLEKGKVRNVNRPNKYDKARSKPGRY
jgi:RHS repeat-associated protein